MGNPSNKGFTLIELLVVIAIIGLLSSVVLASLNSARVRARDARRDSDMRQVVNALELYATNNYGAYPIPANPGTGCGGTRPGYCLGDGNVVSALVPAYLPALPTDPQYPNTINDYLYTVGGPTNNRMYVLLRRDETNGGWCVPPSSSFYPGHAWNTTYPAC